MLSFPTCVCHSMLSGPDLPVLHGILSRDEYAQLTSPFSYRRALCCFWLCISTNNIVLSLSKSLQAWKFSEWHTFRWNCWVIVNCHCHLYFGVSKLFHMLVIAVGMWGRFQSVRFMKCHCLVHPPPQHWAWRLVHSGARQACGEWVILLDWTADYLRERDECYTSFWYF